MNAKYATRSSSFPCTMVHILSECVVKLHAVIVAICQELEVVFYYMPRTAESCILKKCQTRTAESCILKKCQMLSRFSYIGRVISFHLYSKMKDIEDSTVGNTVLH